MIRCSDLLEEYSDYRDGLLDDERMTAIEEHLSGCSSCARYDRVIAGGVAELRQIPEIAPSDDFLPRLQHRIYHLQDDLGPGWKRERSGVSAGFATALAVAIVLAAWIPVITSRPATVTLAPITAQLASAPKPVPSLFRTGPLLTDGPAADVSGVRTIGLASNATPAPFRVTFRVQGSTGP